MSSSPRVVCSIARRTALQVLGRLDCNGLCGARAGVKRHSRNNLALKDGLEALGAHCGEIPRNCSASGHECSYCCFGCPSGGKQDASSTWLLDAVNAGARILTGRPWHSAAAQLPLLHSAAAHQALLSLGVHHLLTSLCVSAKYLLSEVGELHCHPCKSSCAGMPSNLCSSPGEVRDKMPFTELRQTGVVLANMGAHVN